VGLSSLSLSNDGVSTYVALLPPSVAIMLFRQILKGRCYHKRGMFSLSGEGSVLSCIVPYDTNAMCVFHFEALFVFIFARWPLAKTGAEGSPA
jgi:hypothetical protein